MAKVLLEERDVQPVASMMQSGIDNTYNKELLAL